MTKSKCCQYRFTVYLLKVLKNFYTVFLVYAIMFLGSTMASVRQLYTLVGFNHNAKTCNGTKAVMHTYFFQIQEVTKQK